MTRNGGKPMKGNNSTTAKAERLPNNKELSYQWKTIDWKKAEKEVNRLKSGLSRQQWKRTISQ